MSSIIRPATTTIINFFDLERISSVIDHTKIELEKLDKELQFYRPKNGRTITDLNSGQAGYLPILKQKDPNALAAIENIKLSIEKLSEQFARDTKGFEKSLEGQITPILDLIEGLTIACGSYRAGHR